MTLRNFCFVLLLVQLVFSFDGRPVLDENGKPTGLINYNPDPNDEPWIGGGLKPMTEEERAVAASFPEMELTAKTRNRALPREVLLMENEEFPPVFNQMGGSCAQASGVAYLYSYQMNVLEDKAGTDANIKAYGFTHNYLNRGDNSNGSWYWDGWKILQKVGAPTATIFHNSPNGGLSGTRWMNGADRWHQSNDNRVDEIVTIKVTSMEGIEKIKNWMYDLNGADPKKKGGCVVFAADGGSASANSTVSSGPHAGDALCTKLSKENMNHAMTFAGYSDDVEGGAVLLLNSWGSGWGTGGTVWVPYTTLINGGLYNEEVWCVTTKKFTPKLELKAKVKHSSRNNIKIITGMSNDLTASTASSTKTYARAFNNDAGAHPMEGKGGSQEIEVSLDVSELYDEITGGDAKFFFTVESSGGSGTIRDVSLLDYTQGATPVEFFSEDGTVTISGTSQATVIMSSSPNIRVVSPNGGEEIEQYTTLPITWGDNIDGKVKIELMQGNTKSTIVAETESDGLYEWLVPADAKIASDYKVIVTSIDDPTLNDESDAAFSVVAEFIISEFPHEENFDDLDTAEQNLPEGWAQSVGDDIDWTIWSGPTPSRVGSSPDSTGPTSDISTDGNYIYVEASDPNNPGKEAIIVSPKFDIRNIPNPKLTCKIHMFSARKEMGVLALDISVDGEWKRVIKKIDADQGDQWIDFEQDLSDYVGERVKFRFSGTTGDSWCSDICIDELVVDGSESVLSKSLLSDSQVRITNGYIELPKELVLKNAIVTLFTVSGKEVYRSSVSSSGNAMSISLKELNVANGMYLCKIETADHSTVHSVVFSK